MSGRENEIKYIFFRLSILKCHRHCQQLMSELTGQLLHLYPHFQVELGSIPLLETPPGEQPPSSPRLLGYGGAFGGYSSSGAGYEAGFPSYGGGELVMMAGGTHVGVESLAQAAVILCIGVAIIISNIIILATFITMPGESLYHYHHHQNIVIFATFITMVNRFIIIFNIIILANFITIMDEYYHHHNLHNYYYQHHDL